MGIRKIRKKCRENDEKYQYSERKGEYFSLDQEKKGYSERRSKESDYLEKRSNLEAT